MESEGGVYHVISRGNYRADVFRSEKTKLAFLKCLGEACTKTGWRVYAWCVMSNHYHLAIETPAANLVEGMRWLQGTFAVRFNRLRSERGHLFQGRYKSLIVDPDEGLGPLCHYIHLNPVRAKVILMAELSEWRWSSLHWITHSKIRQPWFSPEVALNHAGELTDTPSGRGRYLKYLDWLQEDQPAQKALKFGTMSAGWVIGSMAFRKELVSEHRDAAAALERGDRDNDELAEAMRQDALAAGLQRLGKSRADLIRDGKSEPWKVALASALKWRTTATNRWLGENLKLGALHEVSRKIGHWKKQPDPALDRQLQPATKHKV
jgi:REP element-mobilizing transposase RayT